MKDSLKKPTKKPKAYQDGFQNFYDRDFIVTPDVLIPRPETEQLIDEVLTLAGKPFLKGIKPIAPKIPDNAVVLDVGTGSGCIAITIKKELPNMTVYASDISEKALDVAKKNAVTHGAHISFIISHLLENVNFTPDIIVANLPYVNPDWDFLDKEALGYEPSIALYAEDSGLKLIKELITESSKRKIHHLILEADPIQHQEITDFAKTNGYKNTKINGFILVFKYD